jgi:2-octaprenyl-6-methoxyphenol hydroxylase
MPHSLVLEPSIPPAVKHTEVVIIGGGIVGITLACALAQAGVPVVVIESQPRERTLGRDRAYALSLSSAKILQQLDVWDSLKPYLETFEQIRLSDADSNHIVWFRPEDLSGTHELGYIAEHRLLLAALYDRLTELPLAEVWSPAKALRTLYRSEHALVEVGQIGNNIGSANSSQWLQSQLVIAADGPHSPTRKDAAISTLGWAYWQSCLTCVVTATDSHQHIAQERFWPQGPLAVLPLTGNRAQIIWTAPHSEAQALAQLPEPLFLERLQQQIGRSLGTISLTNQRQVFPVRLMQSRTYAKPRLALVGDAAHNCHPVGGQGLNLGIRDAAALAHVLVEAHLHQEDLGTLGVLRRYDRWQRPQNWFILGVTDSLNRLFSNRLWPLVWIRWLAIEALRRIGPLRRLVLSTMTGQHDRQPKRLSTLSPVDHQHPLATPCGGVTK